MALSGAQNSKKPAKAISGATLSLTCRRFMPPPSKSRTALFLSDELREKLRYVAVCVLLGELPSDRINLEPPADISCPGRCFLPGFSSRQGSRGPPKYGQRFPDRPDVLRRVQAIASGQFVVFLLAWALDELLCCHCRGQLLSRWAKLNW
jgi:hypothetical protein